MTRAPLAVAVLLLGLLTGESAAWTIKMTATPFAPASSIAIDKSRQRLLVLQQQSPLKVVKDLPCSTGQKVGDKQVAGDLRTPEGVYFIEGPITQDLDYTLYGGMAYALNFPNPVDRLKGKTGSGIWLHGRGKRLTPQDTRGCVAMDNDLLSGLGAVINNHQTPMLIGEQAQFGPDGAAEDPRMQGLAESVTAWARAWEDAGEGFFSFYDEARLARSSGQGAQDFRQRKVRLFGQHPWIQVFVDDVRVVEGPDYWVTYFGQYYRTPTLVTEGVKRLYWQETADGLRIVGEEWLPKDLNLEDKYLADLNPEVAGLVEAWRKAWLAADLKGYLAFYHPGSRQDQRTGIEAIAAHKQVLWTASPPQAVDFGELSLRTHPRGLLVSFDQTYRSGSGYQDVGRKDLVMAPEGRGWRIIEETWRPKGGS